MAAAQIRALPDAPNEADAPEADFDPTLLALTAEEAARRLSIGRTTMYALIRAGAVQTITIGRLRRVPVQAISDYLADRMRSNTQSAAA
ncbi:helix-turn-helix domain-containing protein [Streptomyces hygroscopicus subsp. hygroscopicus]|uniref:helix-turn-helix domain-containing protein n=1 Tax=Streptomyces hygroscopicus TaxID=1912 RepID=UPI001C65C592|nr:helix-turn-helix domain-containing protein [Streptomyces hygroscopicus]MBW8088597.1 helix-turn-helix domain-containing protein [Streptomyces hygroscopicus subsp. hygroscopicus]